MSRDEFDPDEIITIDGQPTITVGRLAEIAFENEAAYRKSVEAAGLGILLDTVEAPDACEFEGCDRAAEYVGIFLDPVEPRYNEPGTAYCGRCGHRAYAEGRFADVETLFGQPAVPPEPFEGKHGTGIGWTHMPGTRGETIVSVTGCDPVSPGCDNCYSALASSMPRLTRLDKYAGVAVDGKFTGLIKLHPQVLNEALAKRRRTTWFHNSMSDTFHAKVPDGHIAHHFAIAAATPWHNWIDLTKRHGRMASLLTSDAFRELVVVNWKRMFPDRPFPGWPLPNIAVGVSVEDQQRADLRMPHLERIVDHVACVFVSAEPLLGPVDLTRWLDGPGHDKLWVIAGGESGPNHRPVDLDHVRALRDQCALFGVPFYYKQQGGLRPTSGGRLLDGAESDQWPAMAYRPVPEWTDPRKATT